MKQNKLLSLSMSMLMSGGALALPSVTLAGTKLELGGDRWISLGAGLRSSFSSNENGAPSGSDRSSDFDVGSVRIYINGQVHKYLKMTFNTERDSQGDIQVIDGIARFEFSDALNIWAGRFLPPSDRSNFSGPYYLGTWQFPIAQAYPFIVAGRDEGIALWGQTGGGQFKYQFGMFEGARGSNSANVDDSPLFAGRLTMNFWEPEPGYYNSSTYFGSKDILAVGLAAMSQDNASGTATNPGSFLGWSADVLMEKKLGGGTALNLEGAYYDYDLENKAWSGENFGPTQGTGYFALAGYTFNQFQPHVRYESFEPDVGTQTDKWTLGLTYLLKGHDARITGVFGEIDPAGGKKSNFFELGVQIQI